VDTRAFTGLSVAYTKDLYREPVTLWMGVLFPYFFLIMFAMLPDLTLAPGVKVDGLAFALPGVLVMALLGLALLGTATPLTILRDQGVLRALAVTPVRRITVATAIVPGRLAVAALQISGILAIAGATGVLHLTDAGLLLAGLLLSLAATASIGTFLGGVVRSVAAGSAVSAAAMPAVLLLSGVLMPLSMMPDAVAAAAQWVPFTYMGDLLRHCIAGTPLVYPIWRALAVLAGTAVLMVALTAATFRFDEGEQ
jgi:ABC-2 type transport system permease protein